MYLSRRRYIKNWDHNKGREEYRVVVMKVINGVAMKMPLENVTHVEEEVGYWRKANAVHQFFVDLDGGRDDCQKIDVSRKALTDLLRVCKQVLADPSKAAELLPTQEGFFFGTTQYDDWYFEGLRDTVKIIEPLLDDPDDGFIEYVYQASW
jgi:hypothetical protein